MTSLASRLGALCGRLPFHGSLCVGSGSCEVFAPLGLAGGLSPLVIFSALAPGGVGVYFSRTQVSRGGQKGIKIYNIASI